MMNFKNSPDFSYMHLNIHEITNKFLKYVDTFLEHYDTYEINNSKHYHHQINII